MNNKFLFNLNLVLAHSRLFEAKELYSPDGIVDDARNGGDPPAQAPLETTAQSLQAYNQYLPSLIKTTSAGILPMEQATAGASAAVSPEYNQLSNQALLSNAQGQLNVLNGPGKDLQTTQQGILQGLDPQFFQARDQAASGYTGLLNQLNPNNPNPAASRDVLATNQATGNVGNSNATTTTANALQFGNEDMARSQAFGTALGGLTNFMQGSLAPATSPNGPATASQYASPVANVGASTNALSSSLLGDTSAAAMQSSQINANRRDSLDRVDQTMSSVP